MTMTMILLAILTYLGWGLAVTYRTAYKRTDALLDKSILNTKRAITTAKRATTMLTEALEALRGRS